MRLSHTNMSKFEEYKPYIDTLILPIGTIEAHGPHAPLGTDVLIPRKIADLIEERLSGRVWTAPEIAYGHCFHLRDFPGTIDVPSRIFADYVHAVVSSFARWDIKHVVLLNGHGGNITALNEVGNTLTEDGLHVLISNYWLDYQDMIRELTPGTGHAGEDETSLVMAVLPNGVDLALVGEPTSTTQTKVPGMEDTRYPEAYSGDPRSASAGKGDVLFERITERLVQEIMAMWNQ